MKPVQYMLNGVHAHVYAHFGMHTPQYNIISFYPNVCACFLVGISVHERLDVVKHGGLALCTCYGILIFIVILANVLHNACRQRLVRTKYKIYQHYHQIQNL